uniref:Uncharacterized protein n=1 Tax=Oryza brachyantha TaxID=4533 RepID=J3N449_ORYBR
MAHVMAAPELVAIKRPLQNDGGDVEEKPKARRREADPAAALAAARHEFGEHGGVNMSIEASATFTVMEPDTMRRLFAGELGPERGDLGDMWAGEPGERDDGPAGRGPDAAGPDDERQGGVRAVGAAPPPAAADAGALPASGGVRVPDAAAGPARHVPRPPRPPAPRAPPRHGQPRVRRRRHAVRRHGHGGARQPPHAPPPEHHPVRPHGRQPRLLSLGYYETLMSCSGSSTSSEMSPADRARAGISPGLVRMSVGYNGTLEQRWSQFERALSLMQQQQQHPDHRDAMYCKLSPTI